MYFVLWTGCVLRKRKRRSFVDGSLRIVQLISRQKVFRQSSLFVAGAPVAKKRANDQTRPFIKQQLM